jgi:hypothetical protein
MVNLFCCELTRAPQTATKLRVVNTHAAPCVVAVEISSVAVRMRGRAPIRWHALSAIDGRAISLQSQFGRALRAGTDAGRCERRVADPRFANDAMAPSREGEPVVGGQGVLTVCTGSPGK